MGQVNVTQQLAANPAQLYATISDTSTWGNWFSLHHSFVEEPPEHLEVGVRLVENIFVLGMTHKVEMSIATYRPPMELVLTGVGPGGTMCEFTFNLQRCMGGSRLTISGEFSGPLLTAQLAQTAEKEARSQLENSIERLANLSASGETSDG